MSNEPIGTPYSHYAPPKDGPFLCGNCAHFTQPHFCVHPEVIRDGKAGSLKLGRLRNRDAGIVAEKGCCNYYRKR